MCRILFRFSPILEVFWLQLLLLAGLGPLEVFEPSTVLLEAQDGPRKFRFPMKNDLNNDVETTYVMIVAIWNRRWTSESSGERSGSSIRRNRWVHV